MSRDGFVMVPRWLLARRPSGNALLVYVALAGFGTWNPGSARYEECRPSIPTLAGEIELSETTVRKAIKELLKLGGLQAGGARHNGDGGQLPTIYRVIFGVVCPPPNSEGGVVQKNTPGGVAESEGNQEPSTKNPSASQRGRQLPEAEKTTPESPSASPRGQRLPEDWTPSDALLTWFVTELVPGGRWSPASRMACKREHAKFVDHWKAAAGTTSRKRDWDAAWRNWMRRAFEGRSPDAPTSGAPFGGPRPSGPGGPKLFEQMREDRTAQRKTRSELIEIAMDHIRDELPQLGMADVVRKAAEYVDAHLKDHPDGLSTRTVTGYINGDVIDSAPKEVTGNAA